MNTAIRFPLRAAGWLLPLMLLSAGAWADCAIGNGTVNLGTQSSFTAYTTQFRAQGTGGLSCTGATVNLLTNNTVRGTIQSTTNAMRLANTDGSGDAIPYLIYPDPNYQYAFSTGQTMDYGSLGLLPALFQSSNVVVPVYIRTTTGANVRSGTYTDVINISWTYSVCTLGVVGACLSAWTGTGVAAVTVTAIITKDCAINSTPNVNLGSMALVSQFSAVTQSVTLTCTKTEGYKTYFTNGNNYGTPWRRMRNGTTSNYIQYQIYQANGTTIWDSNSKLTGIGTGLSQSLSYVVRVNTAQLAQPAGNYSDTVSLVLEY
ncbi:spore coat protein [Chimaeribacter arupi]|uniref:Spore coat protein n=2 Tax=Yersiniaceae TaxID=1903411 RepID=A0A2N5ET39_9GAMM|nr:MULTISPECIES: spore coat protein U domain-containing protein [Yersiniaceae]MBS0969998.1 spore coat protein U domain-containing protein [Nissabacter archeti]MDV5140032.1 spore coat protein U domain-containing protein [Chimaeribacter arupi]PLR40155.1 spore coat protein [Chimaeribacter arupi]PLR49554.1 spore coat protein [Chimaeribacter arupi]PLR51373.1 spore coat protein [Chimaeribacter arupi]